MHVLGSVSDIEMHRPEDAPPYEAGTIYQVQSCPDCGKHVLVSGDWHDGMDELDDWQPKVLLPESNDRDARRLLASDEMDRYCMRLAVDEARKCVSEPGSLRPKVGAVVASESKQFVAGHRGELALGDHAEFTVLEGKCKDDVLAGATVYTTLEPCTTRNPPKVPCVSRLIGRKVTRVVIGMLDPDERIRGRGVLALRKANIRVDLFPPDLMTELEEMNRDFIAERERPHPPPPLTFSAVRGRQPLLQLVPEDAAAILLVGQNLVSRLGRSQTEQDDFRMQIRSLLSRPRLIELDLMVMSPEALTAIHPEAAKDLQEFTIPALGALADYLGADARRVQVMMHPAATLSVLAIDWANPTKRFAFITPKFQRTDDTLDRISIRLEGPTFDAAPLDRMVQDAIQGANGAARTTLGAAPTLLRRPATHE
jgi:pyrimidine deaminase RibD-like protein